MTISGFTEQFPDVSVPRSDTVFYTDDEISNAMEKALAAKGGDYVYTEHHDQCAYQDRVTDAPLCLVGYVLFYLGDPAWDAIQDDPVVWNTRFIDNPVWEEYTRLTPRQRYALVAAQYTQDSGYTWAQAFQAFRSDLTHE